MQQIKDITFKEFLAIFPDAELPMIISKDSVIDFSRENVALPVVALEKYLYAWDKDVDEYVEFIPCFKFKMENNIFCLVYYKASLLSYEYFLVTVNKSEQLISRKIIAGIITDNQKTIQSAATITDDYCIYIAGGLNVESELFDAQKSKQTYMEITPTGEIVSINDEN